MGNINRIFGVFYHLILSLMASVGNSCFGAGLLWPGIAGGVGGGGGLRGVGIPVSSMGGVIGTGL